MRLDKYLSDRNAGTRKEIREAVRAGRVAVDGVTAADPGMQLKGGETVSFDGRALDKAAHVYYMMHKPAGVVTAVRDARHQTVIDLMGADARKDLFPVGRLDLDTTGLLLLTNDGAFDHALMSPKRHVPKMYEALVSGQVEAALIDVFAAGVDLGDFRALPAALEILSSGETSEVRLTIHEGKFHQVKRMFLAAGHEVLRLTRIRIGNLPLDETLEEGAYRPLREEEIALLLQGGPEGSPKRG